MSIVEFQAGRYAEMAYFLLSEQRPCSHGSDEKVKYYHEHSHL
jgi:hypothetical protein